MKHIIRIRQVDYNHINKLFNAIISFNGEVELSICITNPFSNKEEETLEWYFEKYLEFPFVEDVLFRNTAQSINSYGEILFNQIFKDNEIYSEYKKCLNEGIDQISFEIAGYSEFHAIHWECLKDPKLPNAWALLTSLVRKNLDSTVLTINISPSPKLNMLIVTARPYGRHDVGYRTISRPLVEALQTSKVRVDIDILRPGTYKKLCNHLESIEPVHYHIIHLDLYGSLMTYDKVNNLLVDNENLMEYRYGRNKIKEYSGKEAFVFM